MSWVWILWLRRLWTEEQFSFRIRCCVSGPNLSIHCWYLQSVSTDSGAIWTTKATGASASPWYLLKVSFSQTGWMNPSSGHSTTINARPGSGGVQSSSGAISLPPKVTLFPSLTAAMMGAMAAVPTGRPSSFALSTKKFPFLKCSLQIKATTKEGSLPPAFPPTPVLLPSGRCCPFSAGVESDDDCGGLSLLGDLLGLCSGCCLQYLRSLWIGTW